MIDSTSGIIGLITGDAMGVPLEFQSREVLMKNMTTTMKGYGSHDVPKGAWSDDSSMTIATIDALIESSESINYELIANNFKSWLEDSKYTPCDFVFDVGRTSREAILNYINKKGSGTLCGLGGIYDNGNGSLMRILPIIYFVYSKHLSDDEIYKEIKNVSSITHKHEISILGCFIYSLYAIKLLEGKNLYEAYDYIKAYDYKKYFSDKTISIYDRVIRDDISLLSIDDINSTGYVVDTLEASLWTLLTTNSYNDAIIKAINLGDDTDTVGAVTGAIAGLFYKLDNINKEWRESLIKYDYLIDLCNKFNEVLNK